MKEIEALLFMAFIAFFVLTVIYYAKPKSRLTDEIKKEKNIDSDPI